MPDALMNFTPEFIALVGILIAMSLLLILAVSNRSSVKKLKAKYDRFMDVSGDVNLERLLENYIEKVNEVNDKNKAIENKVNYIERNLIQCLQKVGIVRFNAFDNVGSDLSFAIALLDNNDNGVVISSIYSRESSSTYAKPIMAGKAKHALSAEEIQAIDIAKRSHGERLYVNT